MHKNTIIFALVIVLMLAVGYLFSLENVAKMAYPMASTTAVVALEDGATYDMSLGYVTKEINGTPVTMLAYNGMIPGPTIKVKQGDQVTIRFTNNLKQKTLLHSHGVRMANPYDGSQLTQAEMNPGETFSYILKFPDAGAYFYHPHVRDDIQQVMGAYGNFIVAPNDPNMYPPVSREATLALGDILIEDGTIAPFSEAVVTHALMGRYGNTMFVNGEATPYTATVGVGDVVRYYITNVASVRPFNIAFPGATMKVVGSDASPVEREEIVDAVMIQPSERVIVDVQYMKAGAVAVEHRIPDGKTYPLGTVTVTGKSENPVAPNTFTILRSATGTLAAEFAMARTYLNAQPDKQVTLTVRTDMNKIMQRMMGGGDAVTEAGAHEHGTTDTAAGHDMGNMAGMDHSMMGHDMSNMKTADSGNAAMDHSMMGHSMHTALPIEWEDGMGAMNAYSTNKDTTWIIRDDMTQEENMDVVWNFKKGDMVKVRIVNDKNSPHPMQHPFHVHGNRFVVLATNGVPNPNMAWKDTALVQTGDTMDILIDMSNPGKWMAHCHILEHLHSGMMIEYDVSE